MRSYGQYCALARALDVVGDRWTLLIVRELLLRPCRYRDLQDGLEGIATNLLADRLRHLQDAGVITGDGGGFYRLTERGQRLAGPVRELVRWGAPRMLEPRGDDTFRTRWLELPLALMFEGADPGGEEFQVEIRTADEVLTLESRDGVLTLRSGSSTAPYVVITGPPDAILGLVSGSIDKSEVEARGVSILGDFNLVERLRRQDWLDVPA